MSKRAYAAAVVTSFDPEREGENSPCSTGEKVRYLERLGLLRVLHVVNRASRARQKGEGNGFARNCCFFTARCSVERRRRGGGIGFFLFFSSLGEWKWFLFSMIFIYALKSAPLNVFKYSIKNHCFSFFFLKKLSKRNSEKVF